jgi:predicted acetyltransferase
MRIELDAVDPADLTVLDNLMQLYKYDFSEFEGEDVGPRGRYPFIGFESFFDKRSPHAYVIRADGNIAGFAMAYRDDGLRDEDETTWWMHEFFVMRKYRKRGVGERVATQLFEEFGGAWEVGQVPTNSGARAFWRKVIGRYTSGDYEEFALDDDRWRGTVQYFRAGGRSS